MAKEIWLGPLLGTNRSRLIARCSQLVSEGKSDSFLYLAASHPLLELVTEQILDGTRNLGVWGELPVYLFRGFVRRILSSAVHQVTGATLATLTPIDREELPLKRSLISQILKQLAGAGQLKALNTLAHREGCVNTLSTLIGEIQRAAKSPAEFAEIVSKREEDFGPGVDRAAPSLRPQIDFDRDVALIYSTYATLLQQHNLTEADADQLRAFEILKGQLDSRVPWLENLQLLVIDGFFDFTPVQGEMLRQLIRQIPEVIVNLNSDERNPAIFEPFKDTVEQLRSMATFDVKQSDEIAETRGALSTLRERLFKPEDLSDKLQFVAADNTLESPATDDKLKLVEHIRLFTCTDRETEIRKVAKEVKRLILQQNYRLSDIALVVRERASYADTIVRVMHDEGVPCNLERRINVNDIPAVRAARKLFEMLDDIARDDNKDVRVSDLADLIKSEYFRLDEMELAELVETFDEKYGALLTSESTNGKLNGSGRIDNFKYALGIGRWDPDTLENTIAFVGGALNVNSWLERARKLLANWQQVKLTTDLVPSETTSEVAEDKADQIQDADKLAIDDRGVEKKRRPSRDVHPAAIAWASLVIGSFADLVRDMAREGTPRDLRVSLMSLLERFRFAKQIRTPARTNLDETELPALMLDLRGLESLRRAFGVAVKSIEIASSIDRSGCQLRLPGFLGEVTRALDVEISIGTHDHAGLPVLEATEVRGLRFRAIFIAGLVEGGFPLRASRDWIYPHEERERLKRDYDLTLEDISPATLLKEEHYFYQTACRATEKLYLSQPMQLEDETETVSSYYINELARAIAPFELKNELVRRDFDGAEIFDASTPVQLNISLIRQDERHRHKAGREGLLPLPLIDELRSRALLTPATMRRINIERERASRHFGRHDGQITSPELIQMLQQRFGPEYVHSASGLSTYGNCSYRFFANRVLRLESRGEAALDLQAIDAGKLLHDVLRRFFERYRGHKLLDLDREALRQELRGVADQVFMEHERAVPPLNPDIWKIDCEIRKIILDQVLLYELGVRRQTRADVRSRYFEVAFGMTPRTAADPHSKPEQLELTREDQSRTVSTTRGSGWVKPRFRDSIRIQGQIDRVDEAADGTLIAYDYKLSVGADAEDMKAGRSLQLPIYLEALERLLLPGRAVAGGGYYILKAKPGRRNSGIYRKDFADYLGLAARNSILTDSEWQKVRSEAIARIWEFFERMNAGDFRVRPSQGNETCRFCDYSAVCRYDKYRIQWKENQGN
ncbi:MAG TPA: PD-(D/E)XK nuclease family protein [Pyrinomonadaceae bacterium]|nr:PD-(D/E)XK nuclease family protein [Pyrinomonadaceae bacterium]